MPTRSINRCKLRRLSADLRQAIFSLANPSGENRRQAIKSYESGNDRQLFGSKMTASRRKFNPASHIDSDERWQKRASRDLVPCVASHPLLDTAKFPLCHGSCLFHGCLSFLLIPFSGWQIACGQTNPLLCDSRTSPGRFQPRPLVRRVTANYFQFRSRRRPLRRDDL